MVSLLEKLPYIDPTEYSVWIDVGMALKAEGYTLSNWVEWSRRAKNFKSEKDCATHWGSFSGTGITGGRIDYLAREGGWSPTPAGRFRALDWNDEISDDWIPGQPVKAAAPTEQLLSYLETLFQPEDYIGYVSNDVFQDEDGRWKPKAGVYARKAEDLIKALKKHPEDIKYAIGDYNAAAGAWIRFNPLDGEGAGNKNVTEYRYALVESDNMPIDKQKELLIAMQLPVAALVYSGGKSVHAIVKVDAPYYDEYKKRVEFLYGFLKENGIEVDVANRNPSRLSRMPGVMRNGIEQTLIATNIGKASWAAWMDYVDGEKDDLPHFRDAGEYIGNPPQMKPAIIDGLLRQGHKASLTGPSKAGKSFCMMQLAVAIATGGLWMRKFRCKRGKVLYVNMEIDKDSFANRFDKICDALRVEREDVRGWLIDWTLRGKVLSIDDFADKLIRRIKGQNFSAVIVDPIYKLNHGDENSAGDVGSFLGHFDRIIDECGCSIIYCHHHAKGDAGSKNVVDRGSGSGTFGRDADCIIDISPLAIPPDRIPWYKEQEAEAFRMTFVLREFKNADPVDLWFDYPLHHVDESGNLAEFHLKGSMDGNLSMSPKRGSWDDKLTKLRAAYQNFVNEHENSAIRYPTTKDMASVLEWGPDAIEGWFKDGGKLSEWFSLVKENGKNYIREK